eukprot:8858800-Pyramimonas_sp.AAC.1
MQEDIRTLRVTPHGRQFLDQGHSVRDIFTEYRIATAFGSIDPKGLRRAYWEHLGLPPTGS